MALVRSADAVWQGDLKGGKGSMKLSSGAYDGQYSYRSRFEEGTGTNPEELIGAAHAGCFSMQLSHVLAEAGHTPESVHTTAKVKLDGGQITEIALHTEGSVPSLDEAEFQKYAKEAEETCLVSKALAAVDIKLNAKLV